MESLRILLAVAAFNDWEIHQIDVKIAYLEVDLCEYIFMKIPEDLNFSENLVKINKALYGLKQTGEAWYEKLDEILIYSWILKSISDPYIYIHNNKQIVIGVYVDDLVICGSLLANVTNIKSQLSLSFPTKDLGLIDTVIGWKIIWDRTNRALCISQSDYIRSKIESIGLSDAKEFNTSLERYSAFLLAEDKEEQAENFAYPSNIGSLGYASNSTRPDICFAKSQSARFTCSPVIRYWKDVYSIPIFKGYKNYQISYKFGTPHT